MGLFCPAFTILVFFLEQTVLQSILQAATTAEVRGVDVESGFKRERRLSRRESKSQATGRRLSEAHVGDESTDPPKDGRSSSQELGARRSSQELGARRSSQELV